MADRHSEQDGDVLSPETQTEPNGVPFDTVVIVGRGSYGAAPRQELERLVASVARAGSFRAVRYAFLEQGKPALSAVLEECLAAGARRLLVVPGLVPMDRTLRWWLPLALRDWLREHADADVEVALAPPLGDSEHLADAFSAAVLDARSFKDVREDPTIEERRRSWNHLPSHRHHVLLCSGPRCTLENAPALWEYFEAKVRECRLRGKQRVMMVRTGCLYPCDLGPMMVVHPDGTWYGGVDETAVDRIVAEHIVDGEVVQEYACTPGARQRTKSSSESG